MLWRRTVTFCHAFHWLCIIDAGYFHLTQARAACKNISYVLPIDFNSLRPSDVYGLRQAIIWTNTGILLIWPWRTIFSEMLIEIYTCWFEKMHVKMSSVKRRTFCLGLNVLMISTKNILYFSWPSCARKSASVVTTTLLTFIADKRNAVICIIDINRLLTMVTCQLPRRILIYICYIKNNTNLSNNTSIFSLSYDNRRRNVGACKFLNEHVFQYMGKLFCVKF